MLHVTLNPGNRIVRLSYLRLLLNASPAVHIEEYGRIEYGGLPANVPHGGSPCLSVEIERVLDRRCQRFLLIRKKEPDLTPQCRNRDRDNVVDADDGISLEPVTHTHWNFGRQAARCSGDRCHGDAG